MATKLFLVEGLPGSGKSTTAKVLYNTLNEKGMNVEIYYENDLNHPADFDGVAYFGYEDFEKLKQGHLEKRDILDKIKIPYYQGILLPYRKAMGEVCLGDRLIGEIVKNDIYELPIDLHIRIIQNRWSEFVELNKNDKIIIFECCFIQNPVTVTMIRENLQKQITINYISNLASRVDAMKPILIYVEQNNIRKSFNKAKGERTKEWYEGFCDYYTKQGYGMVNKLGVIGVLEARKKLEEEIYDLLNLKKYKIDNSEFNGEFLEDRIRNIVEESIATKALNL